MRPKAPRRGLDTAALRRALAGPGADTRRWADHVLLTSDPVVEDSGIYADGEAQPSGEPTTVRLAPLYVDSGSAVYLPARKGDLLVVVYPSGGPGGGAVEVARLPSGEDPMPAEVQRRPLDLWVIARPGRHVRIRAVGEGSTLELRADRIVLETTGQIATSRVWIDGLNAGHQHQTAYGPTIGPPTSSPTNPNIGDLAEWQAGEGI